MFTSKHSWFRHKSLTFRLSVGVLSCVFAGGIGLLLFLSQYSKPIIKSYVDIAAQQSLQKVVSAMSTVAWETEAAALTMKNTLKELETSNIEMMRNILSSAIQTLDYDQSDNSHSWIYVFPDGEVKSGTLYSGIIEEGQFVFHKQEVADFYKKYPWFTDVPKEEKTFWSEPYIDSEHDKDLWVVTCLIPFKFKGSDEYNGLVCVSIDLSAVQKEISSYEFQTTGRFLLLSHNGLYIEHTNPEITLKKTIFDLAKEYNLPQLKKAGEELQKGHSGNILMPYSSVYNSAVIFFYMPVPDINWGVCLVFSQDVFFEPFKEFEVKTLASMIAGLVVLFLLISWICRRATKPLLDLSQIALQYGQGDFSAMLPTSDTQDEIGIMTDAFHRMRDNLLHHIEIIKNGVAEQQRNMKELEIANHIQQTALPTDFPVHPAFEVSASMVPAKSIGGDFYDAFFVDDEHFAVVIADVSGKGIPASLVMMTTKALIKTVARTGAEVSDIAAVVNNELCLNNKTGMFVTAFLAILNIKTGQLDYVNAGHNSPFYKDKDGYKMMETAHDIVLGGLEGVEYTQHSVQMKAGDRLFLYTDGVSEAQNEQGGFYGENRLLKVLNSHSQSPEDTLYFVSADVEKFVNGAERSDDITMLELLYCGASDKLKVFPADVSYTDKLLATIEEDMMASNIDVKQQTNLIVASEEIFSNIAQYAYQTTGRMRLKITQTDKSYTLQFSDYGQAYNPLAQDTPDLLQSADERNIGGLGIFLVRKMTDKVTYQYKNDQNILTISIKKN
ncbi:MAG: SpoIIE family protein phosphatase [Alphaproteobacteria bacterium]|nr:SpoIIE family protein phosphatase [Alphaproteobacteria bacterium]